MIYFILFIKIILYRHRHFSEIYANTDLKKIWHKIDFMAEKMNRKV